LAFTSVKTIQSHFFISYNYLQFIRFHFIHSICNYNRKLNLTSQIIGRTLFMCSSGRVSTTDRRSCPRCSPWTIWILFVSMLFIIHILILCTRNIFLISYLSSLCLTIHNNAPEHCSVFYSSLELCRTQF
jgi:hypothetical protein